MQNNSFTLRKYKYDNMKKTALTFLGFMIITFITSSTLAQTEKDPPVTLIRTEGSGFTFEKIIELPGISKEQAFDRVKQWVLNNFKTIDNNTALDDKGKDNINTSTTMMLDKRKWWTDPPLVSFKISIAFKDNKMKINASQFLISIDGLGYSNLYAAPFDNFKFANKDKTFIYESFDQKFSAAIAAMQEAASKKSDW